MGYGENCDMINVQFNSVFVCFYFDEFFIFLDFLEMLLNGYQVVDIFCNFLQRYRMINDIFEVQLEFDFVVYEVMYDFF